MINIKRFNGALVTPKDDALINDFLINDSGIFEGLSVTHLGANQLQIAAGRGIIKGRDFTVDDEIILAQLSPSGSRKGRLIIRIDMANSEVPISFVTQVATTLPALVQEDINRGGTIYELPLAQYDITELLISNLTFIGNRIQAIKEKIDGHIANSTIHVTSTDKTNWNNKGKTLTHTKTSTVHTLTGLPTASGIYTLQFKAVADYNEGDTFAGGYTAKPMGEDTTLPAKAFVTGDLVSITVDTSGKKLGFKIGGGVNDTLPPQVTNLNVSAGDGKLTVNFDEVATAYQTYLKDYVVVYKQGGIPTGVNDGIKVVVAK